MKHEKINCNDRFIDDHSRPSLRCVTTRRKYPTNNSSDPFNSDRIRGSGCTSRTHGRHVGASRYGNQSFKFPFGIL
nr:MAG: hypothetical protein [Microvirus sp.]